MTSSSSAARLFRSKTLAQVAAVVVFASGFAVLAGWALSIEALKSVYPGFVSMKANTAFCFVLSGLSLFLQVEEAPGGWRRRLAQGCALIVAGIAFLTVIEYLSGRALGIDQLLFKEPAGTIFTFAPGRMALNTAVNFVLFSVVLMILDAKSNPLHRISDACTLLASFFAITTALAYLYDTREFKGIFVYTLMAVHTAAAFLVLGAGLLAARLDRGIMRGILSDGAAGWMGRIFIPCVILIPPALGWLEIYGERTGHYDIAFGETLMVLACIVIGVGIILMTMDWLERSERERQESQERLRLTLEATNDGLWDWNIPTGQTVFSPRYYTMLGYEPYEFPQNYASWKSLIHPEDVDAVEKAIQDHIARKGGGAIELRMRTKSGDWRWILTRGKEIERDPDGRPIRMVGTHTDITELRNMQTAMHQSEKIAALGQLAAGVAHELNNPLAAILGFSESLVRRLPEADPSFQSLKCIEREALRCRDLVRNLLTFARRKNAGMAPENLRQVVEEAMSLVDTQARVRRVTVKRDLHERLPLVPIDRQQIQQVVINLCANAMDAMPQGGTLTVGLKPAGGRVEICVGDTGVGIPPEVRDRIFEPFYTSKELGYGTGLGLSLVQDIIQKHQGSIRFDSEIGRGTTFRVSLPVFSPVEAKVP